MIPNERTSTRGILAIFLGAARHYMRIPRLAILGGTLAWCGWIWWHSSREGNPLVETEFWWGWFTNLGHAPAFALVALGVMGVALKSGRRAQVARNGSDADGVPPHVIDLPVMALVMGLSLAWGAIDEVHQSFVYGRCATVADLVTDGVGAASVLWISSYLLTPSASNRGLTARLALGTSACLLAALWATLSY